VVASKPGQAELHSVVEPLAKEDHHVPAVAAAGSPARVRHHVPTTFQAGLAPVDHRQGVEVRDVDLVVDVDGVVTWHGSAPGHVEHHGILVAGEMPLEQLGIQ